MEASAILPFNMFYADTACQHYRSWYAVVSGSWHCDDNPNMYIPPMSGSRVATNCWWCGCPGVSVCLMPLCETGHQLIQRTGDSSAADADKNQYTYVSCFFMTQQRSSLAFSICNNLHLCSPLLYRGFNMSPVLKGIGAVVHTSVSSTLPSPPGSWVGLTYPARHSRFSQRELCRVGDRFARGLIWGPCWLGWQPCHIAHCDEATLIVVEGTPNAEDVPAAITVVDKV